MSIDFNSLKSFLESRNGEIIQDLFPGGKMDGNEYKIGSLQGEPGKSLSINVSTGAWADFATQQRGGDVISLFAAKHDLNQVKAAKKLADQFGFELDKPKPIPVPTWASDAPINGADRVHTYRSEKGQVLFHIQRYEKNGDDRKKFVPLTYWSDDKWHKKGWPEPRPLYGLENLKENKDVIIVEGEKCCEDAAKKYGSTFITWPGGVQGIKKVDWRPLYGKRIKIWPDADKAGMAAAKEIASLLLTHCPDIKIIDTRDMPEKWDVSDLIQENWETDKLRAWLEDGRTRLFQEPKALEVIDKPTVQSDADTVQYSAEEYYEKFGLSVDGKGNPHLNVDNVSRVLGKMKGLKDTIWYDTFYQDIFTTWDGKTARSWEDTDTIKLQSMFQSRLEMRNLKKHTVQDAVVVCAHQNEKSEPDEWVKSLKWDGECRVDRFFIDCFEAKDNLYTETVSRIFWLSLVARMTRPGCQADTCVIIEGKQGTRKTSALKTIGGKWYASANSDVTSKDFYQDLQGVILLEVEELKSFLTGGDKAVQAVKRAISSATDKYRASYDRKSKEWPRHCITVGTTNEDDYLKDFTGHRRFLPLSTGLVDIDYITKNRDQLFAESLQRISKGEDHWEIPEEISEMVKEEAEKREETGDIWTDLVAKYVKFRDEVTNLEIATDTTCIGIDKARLTPRDQQRIGRILRQLGWKRTTRRSPGSASTNVWRSPDFFTTSYSDSQ